MPQKLAGAGRYVAELAQRLPNEVDLTLVTRRNDASRWRDMSTATVTSPVPNGRVARLAYEAVALGRSSAATTTDVWHAPHYTMPGTGDATTVVTIHDLTFFTNPEWHEPSKVAFFKRAIRHACARANALVCVSEFTKMELLSHVPTSTPIVVAPHGVDFVRFNPQGVGDDALLASLPSAPFVLFVGTFEPRKGIDVLLAAFAQCAATNAELELWLVGQPGWGMDEVERQIEQHPLRSRIRRLGFVADAVLPALYRRARVVVYPSRGEGFGLPVLEAMACGAPVVTSAETVMAEVAGAAARLVPAGDASAVAEAMDALVLLNDEERQRWAARAVAQAQLFTWDRSISRHLEAYNVAMDSR
jgi:glycosyltransferase involved in cell wall biosynthesis